MDIGQIAPRRKKPSAKKKGLTPVQQAGILLGGGALMAAVIGTYLVVTHVESTAKTPALASATMPRDQSGAIIVRAADGSGCRRMKFNNATGSISDDGPAACDESADAAAPGAPPLSSPGASKRFDAISAGFMRR